MPRWSTGELEKAATVIHGLDGRCTARRQRQTAPLIDLSLHAALPLLNGLGGGTRAVLVRQFLRALGMDEYSHVEWRLEHKLVQALVLNAYLPGLIPMTRGFRGALADRSPAEFRSFLGSEFPDGYVVKAALGDSSGEGKPPLTLDDVLCEVSQYGPPPEQLTGEAFIVQERIPIDQEYRVHSLEDRVMDDLTFRRYSGGSIPGERNEPNAIVQRMLDCLPDAIVGGSLLAWDVARKPGGDYVLIEVNFSGFHPVFKRGFHCSGYYHDYNWGACDTARLLNHVSGADGIEIVVHADAPEHPEENRFYRDVAAWQRRHIELSRDDHGTAA